MSLSLQNQHGSTLKIFVLFMILLFSVGGGALYFGHWLGYRLGSDSLGKTAQAYHKLKSEHTEQVEKMATMEEELLKAQQERDVSLSNLKNIRDSFDILQKREKLLISQKEAFQAMISEETTKESLQIFDQSIKPLPENAYEYAFDLVLVKPKGTPARRVNVDLTLIDGEAIVKVPLEKKSYEIEDFRRVQGRFIMPKGFTPKKLRLLVSGVGSLNVEQYYNWRKGKRIKNMPQSLIDVPPIQNLEMSIEDRKKIEQKAKEKSEQADQSKDSKKESE